MSTHELYELFLIYTLAGKQLKNIADNFFVTKLFYWNSEHNAYAPGRIVLMCHLFIEFATYVYFGVYFLNTTGIFDITKYSLSSIYPQFYSNILL